MSDRRPSPFKTLLDSDVCTLIEAADDLYQVRFKNRAANAYLVQGSKRTILIDVGLSSNYPHLLTCLSHVEVTPEKIDMVALSREHPDHIGAAYHFNGRTLWLHIASPQTRSCCATTSPRCEKCSTSRTCRSTSTSGWRKAI